LGLSSEAPVVRSFGKRTAKAAAATPAAPAASAPADETPSDVATTVDEGPKMVSLYPATSAAPILENILSAVLQLRNELPVGSVPYSILSDPVSFGLQPMADDPLRPKCEELASRIEGGLFTAAQHQVFSNLLSRRLQCVWGPPGSGKTHFASTAVAIMAQARMSEAKENESPGRPFRVLVTAFTHSSIDNLIEKIIVQHGKLTEALGIETAPQLPVARLVNKSSVSSSRFAEMQKLTDADEDDGDSEPASSETTSTDAPVTIEPASDSQTSSSQTESSQSESVTSEPETSSADPAAPSKDGRAGAKTTGAKRTAAKKVAKRPSFPQVNPQICYADNSSEIRSFMEDHQQCVVSGTVWAIRKSFKLRVEKPPEFDLIVVDEASQLLLAHALDPLKYLLSTTGRLIVAGDHQQLPPIINGTKSTFKENCHRRKR
jgi:hypothetical protein